MGYFHKFCLWNKLESFDVFSFIRFERFSRFSHWKVWGSPLLSHCLGFCSKLKRFNNHWIHLIFKEFCWILSEIPSPPFQIWGAELSAWEVLYFVGPEEIVYWDTLISSQVSNCDGVVLEIYLDHKFLWQTLPWSLEFAIQINLEHDTIANPLFFFQFFSRYILE